MRISAWLSTVALLAVSAAAAFAQYDPVYARNGMVAAPEPNAARVGAEVLKAGGNAFDAAVAVGFALAVTYPAAGNLGGGGFLTGLTAQGEALFVDFRETAPAAASRDMYLDDEGNLVEGLSTDTLLAVGVPGTTAGLLSVLDRYGSIERGVLLAPAVRLARTGFEVPLSLQRMLESHQDRISKHESTANIFYPGGDPLRFGDFLRQPDLAASLERIRERGKAGFYEGETADLLADYMGQHGGIVTREDLRAYEAKHREPVTFDYKEYTVIAPNLPSSGGVTLAQILKLVEPFDLAGMGWHSAAYVHHLAEAERLAFADRNYHLGDRDFVEAPLKGLMSDAYLETRRGLIDPKRAGDSREIAPGEPEPPQTTHYTVVDRWGNAAAVTYTLNNSFGMGAVVEGAGFLLNNEMDDFSAKPGEANLYGLVQAEANAVAPGKRMLSSMTPTIVTRGGEFYAAFGTPGGPTIITTNAQIFLNMAEFGMNIREAIDAPRFHHQGLPDAIAHEPFAFSPDTRAILESMGHKFDERSSIGFATGIQAMGEGLLAGHSDARGEGAALGY